MATVKTDISLPASLFEQAQTKALRNANFAEFFDRNSA